MKKIICVIIAVAAIGMLTTEGMSAPAKKKSSSKYVQAYKDGEINFNFGIGYGVAGMYGNTKVPPISLSGEYNVEINDLEFSFGGIFGYAASEYTYAYYSDWKLNYSYFMLGARASLHFNQWIKISNLDWYAGVLIGYNIVSYKETNAYYTDGVQETGTSYLLIGGYSGIRYFFNKSFGLFMEAGYGVSYITVGATVKF